jgi:RNA polymerase sigma factor (sigma-70 family)
MAVVQQERDASGQARTRSLEELYALHAPGLRRCCRRLTRDPHAAEDLMQEVFVRFMTRFPEAPADMNVAGYLNATARNVLWKQLRDDHEIADGEIESWAGPDDDLEGDPERATLLDEQQRIVRRCSAALTGRQRRALTLREIEGRSYAEIGSDLGIGTDAVAQVISRARARLRVAVRRAHVDLDQLSPECRAMLGPLSDYLDGHASGASAEIETHLKECASCRHSLASFETAGSRLRGTLPLVPFAGLLARIGDAVRIGGAGPLDAVRAGALALAAAAAIGGGGMYIAHDLPADSTPHHAQAPVHVSAAAATPISFSPHVPRGSGGADSSPAPAVTPTRHERHHRRPTSPAHPIVHKTPVSTPADAPTVAAPVTAPAGEPVHPAATPADDPPSRPATPPPGATLPVTTPVDVSPPPSTVPSVKDPVGDKVVKPAVGTVSQVAPVLAPVTKAVAPITEPVTKAVAGVTAPVAKAVAPVTDPVTKAVAPVTDPVTKAVGGVTAPVAKAVAPVTDPVTKAVAPVTDPVTKAVAPVTAPIVGAVLPPSAPAAPSTTVPATTTPAATTPAATTPAASSSPAPSSGISLPPVKLGLG